MLWSRQNVKGAYDPKIIVKKPILVLPFLFIFLTGCPLSINSSNDPQGSPQGNVTQQEKDVSGKLALALGGSVTGSDELTFPSELRLTDLQNNDSDLFSLKTLGGADSFASGNGAQVVPLKVGIGYVTPVTAGRSLDPLQVTIPPQELIQILVGEARGELAREATLNNGQVKSSSVSLTGDAVGAVIRNRINLINQSMNPGLFLADAPLYEKDPPLSQYQAVIQAKATVYQFSPVDPQDLSYPYYQAAAARSLLGKTVLMAYDQAVLTAADIFNGGTKDSTNGAFGYYSPTKAQYDALKEALTTQTLTMPQGVGTSDANFPALAPVQVLILSGIASSSDNPILPSFVFVRSRNNLDPAVTDQP